MFPMDREPTPVTVEFTSRGTRSRKTLPNAYAARRFYAAKLAAGADPKVVAQEEKPAMAKTTTTTTATTTAKADKAASNGHVDQATKTIRWTTTKVALVKGCKKLGATSAATAATPEAIAKAGGVEEGAIRHQLNPQFDMRVQDMVRKADHEEGARYYVTAKAIKAVEKATAK